MLGLLGRAEGASCSVVLHLKKRQPHCVVCSIEWLRWAGPRLGSQGYKLDTSCLQAVYTSAGEYVKITDNYQSDQCGAVQGGGFRKLSKALEFDEVIRLWEQTTLRWNLVSRVL